MKFLTKIIQEEVKRAFDYIFENELDESALNEGGYARMVRSLAGMEPSVDTVGIITAENPMARQLPAKINLKRNKELAQELRNLGYGFYQVSGKYGNVEKPFIIPNITKDDIMKLGKTFEQDSVIFVQKTPRGSEAELIETHGKNASVKSKVILPLAQNVEDFFTQYKGRKFVIPFFDDVFKNKELIQGKVVDVE